MPVSRWPSCILVAACRSLDGHQAVCAKFPRLRCVVTGMGLQDVAVDVCERSDPTWASSIASATTGPSGTVPSPLPLHAGFDGFFSLIGAAVAPAVGDLPRAPPLKRALERPASGDPSALKLASARGGRGIATSDRRADRVSRTGRVTRTSRHDRRGASKVVAEAWRIHSHGARR